MAWRAVLLETAGDVKHHVARRVEAGGRLVDDEKKSSMKDLAAAAIVCRLSRVMPPYLEVLP